jgi:hypothetical protein
MDVVLLLEQLANQAHHRKAIHTLVSQLSEETKKAFLLNDMGIIKKQLSDTIYYADRTTITQA